MLDIGIIGVGYWGKNYLRIFNEILNSRVAWCADINKESLKYVNENYPSVETFTNYSDILCDKSVNAICVATTASTHHKISKDVLLSNKHLLVEKPFTIDSKKGEELIRLAKERNRVLMVGHTYIYNSYIQKLREIILNHELGKIYHLHLTRTAPGPIRTDVNCIWDLAPHDISILQYLLDKNPIEVSATAQPYLQKNVEDISFVSLKYPDNILATIHVSWFYPNKARKIVVIGSEKSVVFDDVEKTEKLKLFSNNRKVFIPNVTPSEPLKNECIHFLDCIKNKNKPLTDGRIGLDIVKILEFTQRSLENNGKYIKVKL